MYDYPIYVDHKTPMESVFGLYKVWFKQTKKGLGKSQNYGRSDVVWPNQCSHDNKKAIR